eukprot:344936_1
MAQTTFFYIYTIILSINPIGCSILILLQMASDKYTKRDKKKITKILLYSVYSFSAICGYVGFSLHSNSTNDIWCETFGLPICFGMYGTAKSLAYLFFFHRAEMASG